MYNIIKNKYEITSQMETKYRIVNNTLEYKSGWFWKTVPKPYVDSMDGVRKPFTSVFMFPEQEFKKRHFTVSPDGRGSITIGGKSYTVEPFINSFKDINDYLILYKEEQKRLEKEWNEADIRKRAFKKQSDKKRRTPKYLN